MLNCLKELTSVNGISANEGEIAEILVNKLNTLCDYATIDKHGNVVGVIKAKNASKTLLFEAHMDRIGLMISDVDKDGFLEFVNIGGFDERVLLASEVIINGEINGIIFSKEKNPKISQLRIDTGLSAEKVKKYIKVGDFAIVKSEFSVLCSNQLSSSAMDNRAGIAAVLYALSNIDRNKLACNISVLFSVQEELGLHGAYTGTNELNPDAAIVIDVTHGTTQDTKDKTGVFDLGSGAIICRGPNFDYDYTKQLINTADKNNIPYKIEVASGPSGTSAWAVQVTGEGVPSMLVSIPLKYMHTNVETLDLTDVSATADLLIKAAEGGIYID